MKEYQLKDESISKHSLRNWILLKYIKFMVMPIIPTICLNINKIVDVIQQKTQEIYINPISQSANQTTEITNDTTNRFTIMHNLMNEYSSIVIFGLFALTFMYVTSFSITLIYQKFKPDSNYRNLELYKQDVNQMTPILFFTLIALSIVYSKAI